MEYIKSLDPRITRAKIPLDDSSNKDIIKERSHWQTYEVFHQTKRGDRHIHVGSLHAPNPQMAYVLAKEQFGRRAKCVNLWVVKTSDVFTSLIDDEEMFENNKDKMYREAGGYKVMDKINKFKKLNKEGSSAAK